MIVTLYYILNLPKVWDWWVDRLYTYDADDEGFLTGYNEKREQAYFQAPILGVVGILPISFIEGLVYTYLWSLIV